MIDLGLVKPGSVVRIPFGSYTGSTGASSAASNFADADILVYKDGDVTQRASAAGLTATTTFDSVTGINLVSIDLADNTTAGFWAAGSEYFVIVGPITVDTQTVNFPIGRFKIGMPGAVLNTTIASLSSQTSFTLTVGPAEASALVGCPVYIHDQASAVQCGFGVITAYDVTTKTVTLAAGATYTVAAGDNICIFMPSNTRWINGIITSSVTTVNANQGTTQPLNFTGTAGSALVKGDMVDVAGAAVSATTAQLGVNVVNWNNTVVATPATAGIPDVNVKNMNNVAATSITTINANQGTTQPVNFTGTGASALAKSDMVDVAGAAVSTSSAQIGVNVVNINAVSAGSVTTVAANIGTTQPINFTGTGASALAKSDMVDIAGAAVNANSAQLGVNIVNAAGTAWGSGAITAGAFDATATAEVAGAVWDIVLASHLTAGSTGYALNAAGSAGDPWATALPGAYGAGTAGKIIGDNINATITSRVSQASFDTAIAVVSGTADSGTTTTCVDAARTEADTDYWKGNYIYFKTGSIAGQCRLITGFTPGSDTITFAPAVTQAVSTNDYDILPGGRSDIGLWMGTAPSVLISGRVDANTQATAAALTFGLTGNITGNLSGSVGSVTGAVGSVTGSVGSVTGAVGSVTGAVGSVTGNVGGNVTGSVGSVGANGISATSIATGAITNTKFAAGAIDAAAVASNAFDADALATDAVTEIVAGVWNAVRATYATAGTFGEGAASVQGNLTGTINGLTATALADFFDTNSGTTYAAAVAGSVVKSIADNAGGSSLTVPDIVAGVWDEALAGHSTAGTAGKALADAGVAANPWDEALPGAHAAGTAGYIIGHNLDAVITSRLAPTVAGRTLDVSATGEAGIDWGNIGSPSTAQNLSGTNIDVDQVVASVTGAVGSVTGNVGGNVAGSVGSVTGAVGSVTGNVGGNVAGSVASVTGDIGGNLTGNVGGSLVGTVGRMSQAALADFFGTNTTQTYGDAVAGSVVKEIADNASGTAITAVGVTASAVLAMLDDPRAEPGQGNPAVNADLATKVDYLYKWRRNKMDNDGTTTKFYADNGTTVDQKQATTSAAGVVTKAEIVGGP